MAASSTTTGFGVRAATPATSPAAAFAHVRAHRRRISPQAGRALEILGHAIDYLSDEFVHAGGSLSAHDGQVEAVQLLMGINRQIYFDCPEIPTFGERCRALLHRGKV
jgi:hypothetical protein